MYFGDSEVNGSVPACTCALPNYCIILIVYFQSISLCALCTVLPVIVHATCSMYIEGDERS